LESDFDGHHRRPEV
jgi:hypothetical protein